MKILTLQQDLSWCPVTDVAATLSELLFSNDKPCPVYHIENPQRQPWQDMILVLADALGVSKINIIPFHDWISRVRRFSGSEADNPACRLVDFLESNFVRMSCGELILDTTKSTEHSPTLRKLNPLSDDMVKSYIHCWKNMGFLRTRDIASRWR